jgi:cation transporter-like permease
LIGGIIGAAATTVFLIGFCSDSDTKCELDEVGRAALFIAVPAAAVGALIGSLIHTED